MGADSWKSNVDDSRDAFLKPAFVSCSPSPSQSMRVARRESFSDAVVVFWRSLSVFCTKVLSLSHGKSSVPSCFFTNVSMAVHACPVDSFRKCTSKRNLLFGVMWNWGLLPGPSCRNTSFRVLNGVEPSETIIKEMIRYCSCLMARLKLVKLREREREREYKRIQS